VPRLLLIVPVVAVFAAVLCGGHWYIAERVIVAAGLPAEAERALLVAIALCAATLVAQPIGERLLRPPYSRLIAWPASLWMGLFFYLFLLVAFSDLLLFLVGLLGPKQLHAAAGVPEASHGLARLRAVGVFAAAFCLASAGIRGGLAPPALKRIEVWLERWPRSLDGFRIVQLSDIHIGPIRGREFSRHLSERVNALSPDLVAVTGDLVDGSVSRVADEVAPFATLRAPHGVFFVTGNHDHYSGASRWCDVVRGLGMRVLRNERVSLQVGAETFELAGVDDHRSGFETAGGGEDLDAALSDLPAGRPVILLAHDPSTFKRACGMGVDLQISGHTHGGQIWPFAWFVRLAIPFVAGLYRRAASQLYVSRGTGFWGPPMRLFAPAEITEIRLRSGAEEPARATRGSRAAPPRTSARLPVE
jgi:predicted MPP superfamily phosphohydrolase